MPPGQCLHAKEHRCQFQRISASDNATYKLTVDTAFTAAPESGDTYGYADSTYPIYTMLDLLNDALLDLGLLEMPPDITTITIASEKTEYTGSVDWKRSRPYKIEKATTSDTNDYRPVDINDWEFLTAAAGTTPTIVFKKQYDTSYPVVRVYYKDLHPVVTTYSSKIREEFHPSLVTAAFVVQALEWYRSANEVSDPVFLDKINKAEQGLAEARLRYKIPEAKHDRTKMPDLVF